MERSLSVEFERALLSVDRTRAEAVLREGVGGGSVLLLEPIVTPALERIGHSWEQGAVSLSQVYMAGKLAEELVTQVSLTDVVVRAHPKMAITVLGDSHFLGKRMVLSALRAGGFQLLDFGRSTVAETVARVLDNGVEILLISALMLPSARKVEDVVQALHKRAPGTRVVVGGAPFRLDRTLAGKVGADACGRTSGEALSIVSALVEGT